MDELHDVPGMTFESAADEFRRIGCGVFQTPCSAELDLDRAYRAAKARAAYELCGDDMDGAASALD
jgi:hypothetical protein